MEQKLFISRAGADAPFAAEIGRILQDAGYDVILQQWDFTNRSFMERMHRALADGARVVALLSPEYLRSEHCAAEWQNAIAGDPLNTKSRLILLRVAECEPVGLLSSLAYWDLVTIRDNHALLEQVVRSAVAQERTREAAIGPYWRETRTIVDTEAIRPVSSFSGRVEELTAIGESLTDDGAVTVVHGLGGVGKSSIAREYAWQNHDRYAVVWWLNAQTEDGVIEGLLRLGALLTRGLDQLADRRAAAQQVIRSMLSGFAKPVLLIFDNLDAEPLLRSWQPRTGSRTLVTSRNAAWSSDVKSIALDIWPTETATTYLRRESGRSDLNETEARDIAQALGALPLALSHAAAALRGMRMVTPQRYLEHIAEHLAKAPRNVEYPRPVFATFQTAVAAAEREAPGAAALLCFAAQFAPDAIPDELFRQGLDFYSDALRPSVPDLTALDLHAAMSAPNVDEGLGTLDRLSLLSFTPMSLTYTMHRLVQHVGRELLSNVNRNWSQCAVTVAEAIFPQVEFGEIEAAAWSQCERLLPHARAALDGLAPDSEFLSAARLATRCSVYLRERGDYSAAEPLQVCALRIIEKAYGPDDPEVVASLNNLAGVRWNLGRYREAESLLSRALAIGEKSVGPDHSDVATSLNDLATVYHQQGRYNEAESLFTRALEIREKTQGRDHPKVANVLSNLATVYYYQGRYREAESLFTRANAIFGKTVGSEHPDVALNLCNLATAYREQGRYQEAESLLTSALTVLEKMLGPNHPDVAFGLTNLATVYRRQERYHEAESLLIRALEIREKVLGLDHPDVAYTLNNLATVYQDEGRYDEAESLNKRTLAIREKVLGPDHAEVATSLKNLAIVYCDQGRYNEAEPLYKRALAICEKAFGPNHPDVATRLNELANLYEAQNRCAEAQPLYERALAVCEKTLGNDHALTQAVRERLKQRS